MGGGGVRAHSPPRRVQEKQRWPDTPRPGHLCHGCATEQARIRPASNLLGEKTMKFTELLVTAYDGDTPAFAVNVDLNQMATLMVAVDDAGVAEAAELRVVRSDENPRVSAAKLFETVRELARDLGMSDEPPAAGIAK